MTSHAAHDEELDADAFLALPDDGDQRELLDGVVHVNPSPVPRHQRIVLRLARALDPLAVRGEVFVAPLDVVLSKRTVVQPDLFFVSSERAEIVGPRNVRGPPDLVVEVLSETNRRRDLVEKLRLYASARVPAYWVADPDADRLEVYALHDAAYVLRAVHARPAVVVPDGFPDVRLDLDALFA